MNAGNIDTLINALRGVHRDVDLSHEAYHEELEYDQARGRDVSCEPGSFNMSRLSFTDCGTPACIAGWTLYLAGKDVGEYAEWNRAWVRDGAEWLGVPEHEAQAMFVPTDVVNGDQLDAIVPADAVTMLETYKECEMVVWPDVASCSERADAGQWDGHDDFRECMDSYFVDNVICNYRVTEILEDESYENCTCNNCVAEAPDAD